MEALQQTDLISVEEYLAGEAESAVRHEYLNGVVFAMAGASDNHIALTMNLAFALRQHLGGGPCRVQMAEGKLRLSFAAEDIFYHPDIMALCDNRDTQDYFKRCPKVVLEVLSPSTESTDRREKFFNYRKIETLEEYVIVAQDKLEVTVYRRAKQWKPEIAVKAEDVLRLPSLEFEMPLSEVYRGVKV